MRILLAAALAASVWLGADPTGDVAGIQEARVTRDAAGRIVALDLRRAHVDDAALARLLPLSHLRELDLEGTRVSDGGLEALAPLVELRRLSLWGTRITDAAIGRIAELPRLQSLDLRSTDVTDGALEELERGASAGELGHLKEILLDGTRVTRAGVIRLRSARPRWHIEW